MTNEEFYDNLRRDVGRHVRFMRMCEVYDTEEEYVDDLMGFINNSVRNHHGRIRPPLLRAAYRALGYYD